MQNTSDNERSIPQLGIHLQLSDIGAVCPWNTNISFRGRSWGTNVMSWSWKLRSWTAENSLEQWSAENCFWATLFNALTNVPLHFIELCLCISNRSLNYRNRVEIYPRYSRHRDCTAMLVKKRQNILDSFFLQRYSKMHALCWNRIMQVFNRCNNNIPLLFRMELSK